MPLYPFTKVTTFLEGLAPRERKMVIVGSLVLGIVLIYQLVIAPITHQLAFMRSKIVQDEKTLTFMHQADLSMHQEDAHLLVHHETLTPVSLLSTLQTQIDENGLTSQLGQLKQDNRDAVLMQFQKISFDSLLQLLITVMKEHQVVISQLSANAKSQGMVDAEVVLQIA